MKLTPLLLVAIGAANAAPQGILSDIASAFGFGDDPTTTAHSKTTLGHPTTIPPRQSTTLISIPPPAVASTTPDTSFSSPTPTPTPTDSDSDSSTITSTSSTSTTDTTTSTTPPPTTTSTTTSSSTTAQPVVSSTPTPTPAPTSSSSHVSPAGLAVAVILTLAVVAVVIWLVFRYHPGLRSWWDEREEKRMKERSYRDAIDGPFARSRGGGSNGVRNQALGRGGTRKSVLASFFAPRTVHLGEGKEIRRKPVNWGVNSPPLPGMKDMTSSPTTSSGVNGMEKVALANMAAPMARSESVVSSLSYNSNSHGLGSSASARSSPGITQKELPPMPTPPLVLPPRPAHLSPSGPVELDSQPRERDRDRGPPRDRNLKAGGGAGRGGGTGGGEVHGILGRKSIYELA